MRHAQQNLQWATDEYQGQNRAGDAAQHKSRRPVQGFACLLFQILRGVVIQQYQHARYHQENQTGQPHHRGDVALVFGHFTIQGLRGGIGRLGLRLVAAATGMRSACSAAHGCCGCGRSGNGISSVRSSVHGFRLSLSGL